MQKAEQRAIDALAREKNREREKNARQNPPGVGPVLGVAIIAAIVGALWLVVDFVRRVGA